MHDIAQKQIFFYKLPELELDPDLVVKFPDPDPAKRSGSGFGSATLMKVLWGKDLSRGYLKRSSSMTRMPQKVLAVNRNATSC
jgi:hypothetical protein